MIVWKYFVHIKFGGFGEMHFPGGGGVAVAEEWFSILHKDLDGGGLIQPEFIGAEIAGHLFFGEVNILYVWFVRR